MSTPTIMKKTHIVDVMHSLKTSLKKHGMQICDPPPPKKKERKREKRRSHWCIDRFEQRFGFEDKMEGRLEPLCTLTEVRIAMNDT